MRTSPRRITRLTIVLPAIAVGTLTLGLAGLVQFTHVLRSNESRLEKQFRFQGLCDRIVYYDEVLTMSARLYATTGNPRWKKRYEDSEPQLTSTIEQLIGLAPDLLRESQGEETREANEALVAMETESFELAESGRHQEAIDLLLSREYERQKLIYDAGMIRARSALARMFEVEKENARTWNELLFAFIGGGFILVGIAFVVVFSLLRGVWRERERRIEAEQSASENKTRFLANMSHEIRTPLTAIQGYTDELLTVPMAEEDRTRTLRTIQRNGEHLLTILNDILDLSKIEAGRMNVEAIAFSLVQVLSDVEALMSGRAQERGLALHTTFASEVPDRIVSDPTRLRQILLNLVGNAIKFTEAGSVGVEVSAVPRGQGYAVLTISVVDTGIGIDATRLSSVFGSFEQGDSGTARRFGGSGLGLAICSRLARLMGGSLRVESELGVGSTFTLELESRIPVGVEWVSVDGGAIRAISTKRGTESQGARRIDLTGVRVLMAEDVPDNQYLVGSILARAGASVSIAANGREAVDALTDLDAFDVVLMDMQMPVMDGYEATRTLREMGFVRPIVALTANVMKQDRDKCFAAGCDDCVAKPIDRKALLTAVHDHAKGARTV